MLRILLFITLLICSSSWQAQDNCARKSDLFSDYARFIPQEGSAVFTIRMNYVIPQAPEGQGNFQEDDEDFRKILEETVVTINRLWSKLKVPKDTDCHPQMDFIPDTYIRFELNAIIFVEDELGWNAENGLFCPSDGSWFLNGIDRKLREDPRYANAINVYMPNFKKAYDKLIVDKSTTEPKGKPPCSELPSNSKLTRSSRINMSGMYNKYWWMKNIVPTHQEYNKNLKSWDEAIRGWFRHSMAHTMAHELGHSMGLRHNNEYHGRNECEESIMNQLHGKPHNYLQPTEIGKMHRDLRMTNIREFLAADVYSAVPMVIDEDVDFEMDFRAYEDIIVKSGVTMRVSCLLDLPTNAKIIVESGAELIIDKALVQHRGTAGVEGIWLEKEKKCFLRKKKNKAAGKLSFVNGGSYTGKALTKKL